ncbi:hypothetical protein BX666DRAFT_1891268 [Dichotomocladium elegans]|nr:hypothetical protein BX666DRAFT_1891268 [Dichotomocladium elegans]
MYYTVDQEVTHQVWADMSLWQEHSLPPSPATSQSHSCTNLADLCWNTSIPVAVTEPTSNIAVSQQQQQQQQEDAFGPGHGRFLNNHNRVSQNQGSWLNYEPQEPVTFDDTLRDCINMLSGRKPALSIEIPLASSNNLVVESCQSAPLSTPITTPSPSSSSYQPTMTTTPPLPSHQLQHVTQHGNYHSPLAHPTFSMQQQPQQRSNQFKGEIWSQPQGPMVGLEAIPRRQKPRYNDDEYSPKWVRYSGQLKEGYCDTCTEGRWLQLKNSAYWYHKQFYHGISSVSGKRFAEPLEQRLSPDGVIEGLCHQCGYYVPICNGKRKRNNILWYKHAHKCHIYNKPEKFSPSYRIF